MLEDYTDIYGNTLGYLRSQLTTTEQSLITSLRENKALRGLVKLYIRDRDEDQIELDRIFLDTQLARDLLRDIFFEEHDIRLVQSLEDFSGGSS